MTNRPEGSARARCAVLGLLLLGACSGDDKHGPVADASTSENPATAGDAATPDATVATTKPLTATGPVTGGKGKPSTASAADLAARGYSEDEYFFEGEATAYKLESGMTKDGKWTLSELSKAPFKSRLLVRRPLDASKFNGSVVVEWLNVSGGADGDPGFMYNADEILREGYAFVGVSAQSVGIEGGGLSLGTGGSQNLKKADPERYGSLVHPGDPYSYDIYTRAAQIIRDPSKGDVLKGLLPKRLLAYGESQSAMRMVSYVNGVQPIAKQYDGFFIHSRGGGGVPFDASGGVLSLGGSSPVNIRDDLDAKVFQFQTETDVAGMGYIAARQPDTSKIRSWEVPGTAHADQYITDFNAKLANEGAFVCEGANNGPQPYVIRAGLHALDRWVRDGTEPPTAPLLASDASGALVRDTNGIVLGGIRTPDVDVPIATLSGQPPAGAGGNFWCMLFGSTTPFPPEKLAALYPTHADYVSKVEASARAAREAGFLLEPEEKAMVDKASKAPVPPAPAAP